MNKVIDFEVRRLRARRRRANTMGNVAAFREATWNHRRQGPVRPPTEFKGRAPGFGVGTSDTSKKD